MFLADDYSIAFLSNIHICKQWIDSKCALWSSFCVMDVVAAEPCFLMFEQPHSDRNCCFFMGSLAAESNTFHAYCISYEWFIKLRLENVFCYICRKSLDISTAIDKWNALTSRRRPVKGLPTCLPTHLTTHEHSTPCPHRTWTEYLKRLDRKSVV